LQALHSAIICSGLAMTRFEANVPRIPPPLRFFPVDDQEQEDLFFRTFTFFVLLVHTFVTLPLLEKYVYKHGMNKFPSARWYVLLLGISWLVILIVRIFSSRGDWL
jgi:hypothetical protein